MSTIRSKGLVGDSSRTIVTLFWPGTSWAATASRLVVSTCRTSCPRKGKRPGQASGSLLGPSKREEEEENAPDLRRFLPIRAVDCCLRRCRLRPGQSLQA